MVRVSDGIESFAEALGVMPWVRRDLHRRVRAWNPALWPVVDAIRPDQVGGAQMLILHDPQDPDTSFERAATLAALRPDTQIVPVPGAGHHRIVADQTVMARVAGFLARADSAADVA